MIVSNLGQLDETGRGLSDVGSNSIGTFVILRVVHCSVIGCSIQVQIQSCRYPDPETVLPGQVAALGLKWATGKVMDCHRKVSARALPVRIHESCRRRVMLTAKAQPRLCQHEGKTWTKQGVEGMLPRSLSQSLDSTGRGMCL